MDEYIQLNIMSFKFVEIDLCETGVSGCHHICVKTNGSFYCECLSGHRLLADNKTCEGY